MVSQYPNLASLPTLAGWGNINNHLTDESPLQGDVLLRDEGLTN